MAKKKDIEEVYAGGIYFPTKDAKERLKKAAKNINPKTKEDAALVQGTLAGLAKSLDKYPSWVFEAPQEILDKYARGESVWFGPGDWLTQNKEKYDEQQRQKRRERYARKKAEKLQSGE